MPHSPRPQVRTEEDSDSTPDNIELSYDRPPTNERLALTSKLHPFWKTKNGMAIVVLVILVFIGAIVGGAIGGAVAGGTLKSDEANSTVTGESTPLPPATSTMNSASRTIGEVFGGGTLEPRIMKDDDFSERRTHGRAFFDPSPGITANPTIITPPALFKVVA